MKYNVTIYTYVLRITWNIQHSIYSFIKMSSYNWLDSVEQNVTVNVDRYETILEKLKGGTQNKRLTEQWRRADL